MRLVRPVVLDTNVLVSALVFRAGNCIEILELLYEERIRAVSSEILLAELSGVLAKKFPQLHAYLVLEQQKIRESVLLVQPVQRVVILKDEPDDRVLEAALMGKCDYIVTGDKELLALKSFQGIEILSPKGFLVTYRSFASINP